MRRITLGTGRLALLGGLVLVMGGCAQLHLPAADNASQGTEQSSAAQSSAAQSSDQQTQSAQTVVSAPGPHPAQPHQSAADSSAPTNTAGAANDQHAGVAESQTNDDIWARIRKGFRLPHEDTRRVEAELSFFSNKPEYIQRVTERAEPYLHFIVAEVEKRHMPTEIALLPIVESGFQPFAYSSGRAAGIWQFIPGTGRRYGLRQDWWYDGRRDIVASTRAALDYLQTLHDTFDNSWLLALAAYNCGEGTVERAIRYNQRRHRPTDFWHLDLPRETRSYVPQLLAIRDIIQNPEKFGVSLSDIPDQPYVGIVHLKSQIDLALAAKLAKVPLKELYRLNPGYNRWATDPHGPHRLVLPVDRVDEFEQALSQVPPSKRVHWERHRIRRGDSLLRIAHEYRTTVAVLKSVNKLHGNVIRAGHYLLIPVARRAPDAYALASPQRAAALRARRRPGRKIVHTVNNGDTLWDIARNYKVNVHELTRWNGIAPGDLLRPGQKLVIWVKRAGAQRVSMRTGNIPALRAVHYKVRSGDSLYAIAHRFKVTVNELRRWNHLSKGEYLQPGQLLTLHVDITQQSGSI